MKLNLNKTGLSLAILFGIMHLVWVALSAFVDVGGFVGRMHFFNLSMMSFSLTTGILGVILAFISGYVIGVVFAFIWNKLN